jgi:transcriptional regulator with XRE-family HTH domain
MNKDFADYMRAKRKKLGETVEQFAARCGRSVDWVYSVETRRVGKPRGAAQLKALAGRLGVTYEALRRVRQSEATPQLRIIVPCELWQKLAAKAGDRPVREYALEVLREHCS